MDDNNTMLPRFDLLTQNTIQNPVTKTFLEIPLNFL